MDERSLLLQKNSPKTNSSEDEEAEEEEDWSDEEESCDDEESYYTDSDSSIPEWESLINSETGELLYIDCHPFVTQNEKSSEKRTEEGNLIPVQQNIERELRRSTRGKFLRLLKRRESKRRSKRAQRTSAAGDILDSSNNKVKFQDYQEGEEKEVVLKIGNPKNAKHRNLSLTEKILGINVGTLSDGVRVMVAGILPDSHAKNEKTIKIGDWLKSINEIQVTFQNVNAVLESVLLSEQQPDIHLVLQRVAGIEVTKDPPVNELNCQSRLVKQLISTTHNEELLSEIFCKYPIGVLYLNLNNLSEIRGESEDVVYSYPKPLSRLLLCNSKGIFITLWQLIADITQNQIKKSTLLHGNQLFHVLYWLGSPGKLLLFMIPDICATPPEAQLVIGQIVHMLEFLYGSLEVCFNTSKHHPQVDNFFCNFFIRMLNDGVWTTTEDFINGHSVRKHRNLALYFETVLPAAPSLNLPAEAVVQIDDALTELEASDYREWNEEPLDCQRLFSVLGSALYHNGYLLASHLIYEDLVDVHIFCREQGILHLSRTEPVKTLVLWREVHPHIYQQQKPGKSRRFLMVVGSRKDILAVIMEAGGCTEPLEENTGPDVFYVEEVEATLAHIQELGIPELADRLLATNPGRQVTIPEACNRKKKDLMDAISKSVTYYMEKKPELTSILKHRNSDGAAQSFVVTEDQPEIVDFENVSCEGSSTTENNKSGERGSQSDEDSDRDEFTDESQISNSSFDISELRQTLLSETEDNMPQQLTSGKENVLFHFVQFDATEGILICPPESRIKSSILDLILYHFRKSCLKFHSLFMKTLRFKNMPAQDMAESVMNKSLVAIKEHGTMFECPLLIDQDNKRNKLKFWVVGRLFDMPHTKEVYVCYQDNIPQNIVELAFKIELGAG